MHRTPCPQESSGICIISVIFCSIRLIRPGSVYLCQQRSVLSLLSLYSQWPVAIALSADSETISSFHLSSLTLLANPPTVLKSAGAKYHPRKQLSVALSTGDVSVPAMHSTHIWKVCVPQNKDQNVPYLLCALNNA